MALTVTNIYTVAGEIIADSTAGVRSDYLTDALGSIVETVSPSGMPLDSFVYKPFGALLDQTGSSPIPSFGWVGSLGYRVTGRPYAEVYVRARHYSVGMGAWTTVDPLWPNEPAYTYSRQNPTTLTDPSGQVCTPPAPPYQHNHRWTNGIWHGQTGFGGDFVYGQYCGADRIQNPGWLINPQDGLDDCCYNHDRCLEANYGAGRIEGCAHICCDLVLSDCADDADCSGRYPSNGFGERTKRYWICMAAKKQVYLGMRAAYYYFKAKMIGKKCCCLDEND